MFFTSLNPGKALRPGKETVYPCEEMVKYVAPVSNNTTTLTRRTCFAPIPLLVIVKESVVLDARSQIEFYPVGWHAATKTVSATVEEQVQPQTPE